MNRESLLKQLENIKIEAFLLKFKKEIENYISKSQETPQDLSKICTEVEKLIEELNSLTDEVHNKRITSDEYQNKIPEIKSKTTILINLIPDYYFEKNLKNSGLEISETPVTEVVIIPEKDFTEVYEPVTKSEKRSLKYKFLSVTIFWGLLTILSLIGFFLLPDNLGTISNILIVVFLISSILITIYFLINKEVLRVKDKKILTGKLRKFSRNIEKKSKKKKKIKVKYFFAVGNSEFMVTDTEYNKYDDDDTVEIQSCLATGKIISTRKVS